MTMTPAEFIAKARRNGYKFCFLSDSEILMAKTNEHPITENGGYYAGCTIDSLMLWHFIGHALTLRLPVTWEGE